MVRFDMRPVGYEEVASIISFFPLHFKANYSDSDIARKLVEAQIVHQHIRTLRFEVRGCSAADLALPLATFNFSDISAFIADFTQSCP